MPRVARPARLSVRKPRQGATMVAFPQDGGTTSAADIDGSCDASEEFEDDVPRVARPARLAVRRHRQGATMVASPQDGGTSSAADIDGSCDASEEFDDDVPRVARPARLVVRKRPAGAALAALSAPETDVPEPSIVGPAPAPAPAATQAPAPAPAALSPTAATPTSGALAPPAPDVPAILAEAIFGEEPQEPGGIVEHSVNFANESVAKIAPRRGRSQSKVPGGTTAGQRCQRRGSLVVQVQGAWTSKPFSMEARSREWQTFACVWNQIVIDLRRSDHLSNAEKKELLFYSLGGKHCESVFGVAEYVIFPTMISSPVFVEKMLKGASHDYPSFERTLAQLRDLLCWAGAVLGMIHESQMVEVVKLMDELGGLLEKQLHKAWPQDAGAPLKMRNAFVDLLDHLAIWQDTMAAEEHAASGSFRCASPASIEAATETLRLLQRLFEAIGLSLGVDRVMLHRHVDLEERKKLFARMQPKFSSAAKMVEPEERKPRPGGRKTGTGQSSRAAKASEAELSRVDELREREATLEETLAIDAAREDELAEDGNELRDEASHQQDCLLEEMSVGHDSLVADDEPNMDSFDVDGDTRATIGMMAPKAKPSRLVTRQRGAPPEMPSPASSALREVDEGRHSVYAEQAAKAKPGRCPKRNGRPLLDMSAVAAALERDGRQSPETERTERADNGLTKARPDRIGARCGRPVPACLSNGADTYGADEDGTASASASSPTSSHSEAVQDELSTSKSKPERLVGPRCNRKPNSGLPSASAREGDSEGTHLRPSHDDTAASKATPPRLAGPRCNRKPASGPQSASPKVEGGDDAARASSDTADMAASKATPPRLAGPRCNLKPASGPQSASPKVEGGDDAARASSDTADVSRPQRLLGGRSRRGCTGPGCQLSHRAGAASLGVMASGSNDPAFVERGTDAENTGHAARAHPSRLGPRGRRLQLSPSSASPADDNDRCSALMSDLTISRPPRCAPRNGPLCSRTGMRSTPSPPASPPGLPSDTEDVSSRLTHAGGEADHPLKRGAVVARLPPKARPLLDKVALHAPLACPPPPGATSISQLQAAEVVPESRLTHADEARLTHAGGEADHPLKRGAVVARLPPKARPLLDKVALHAPLACPPPPGATSISQLQAAEVVPESPSVDGELSDAEGPQIGDNASNKGPPRRLPPKSRPLLDKIALHAPLACPPPLGAASFSDVHEVASGLNATTEPPSVERDACILGGRDSRGLRTTFAKGVPPRLPPKKHRLPHGHPPVRSAQESACVSSRGSTPLAGAIAAGLHERDHHAVNDRAPGGGAGFPGLSKISDNHISGAEGSSVEDSEQSSPSAMAPPAAARAPVHQPTVPTVSLASGVSSILGLPHIEETLVPTMEAELAAEHLAQARWRERACPSDSHPLLRLLLSIRLEALVKPQAINETAKRLAASGVNVVFRSLLRACQTTNPSGEPLNEQAQRQLIFFCNSLHHQHMFRPPSVCDMHSLTAFTPHFSEDVTYSMEALQVAGDDNASLLTIIKALCPDEWSNLCERIEGLEKAKMKERLKLTVKSKDRSAPVDAPAVKEPHSHFHLYDGDVPLGNAIVQDWCSDRSQLLSRTVRGVMRNALAYKVLALLEGVPSDHVEDLVSSKFQYLVTCQIYDILKNSSVAENQWKGEAIDVLRQRYPRNLKIAYVEHDESRRCDSSVLLGAEPVFGERTKHAADATRVLYKIRLPGDPILGEGKPENQNHAVIFVHGEYMQTLDMNQDNYLGEAFKMRNLLELFKGDVRIVGFREHIISDSSGLVAGFAASSEFVFGTMIQRFMAWPLRIRLHYGHPDVWDAAWSMSSGGISKASKTIHVSEDVFGGANVIMRGGIVEYTEFIHCGKARDITFAGINQFEQKISGGNALQCMSRDMSRLGANLDLFRLLSLYSTSIGFFLAASLLHTAIITMMLSLISLALCRAETYFAEGEVPFESLRGSVGYDHVYSAEFVIQLGFAKTLPLFIELWLEHSFYDALKGLVVDLFTLKQVFTLFTERTRDFFFDQGVLYGSASYIATGRSFASLTSNFVHLYHLYAYSHFYFAVKIATLALLYGLVTDLYSYYSLATWGVWLLAASTLLSPWVFNPQSFEFSAVQANFREFLMWLDDDPGVTKGMGSWRTWHDHAIEFLRRSPRSERARNLLLRQGYLGVLFIMCMAGLDEVTFDGEVDGKPQTPFSRDYLLIGNGAIFMAFAMVYYFMVGSRLNIIQVFLPSAKLSAFFVCWGIRVGFSAAYLYFVRWLFSDSLSRLGSSAQRNGVMLYASGMMVLMVCTQMLSTCLTQHKKYQPQREITKKGKVSKRKGSAHPQDHMILDFWDREFDVLVGTILYMVLTTLSILPLANLHSKVLFNRAYAVAIGTLNRQNQLVRTLFAGGWRGKAFHQAFDLTKWLAVSVCSLPRLACTWCSRQWTGRRMMPLQEEADETFNVTLSKEGISLHPTAPSSHKKPRITKLYNGKSSWEEVVLADSAWEEDGDALLLQEQPALVPASLVLSELSFAQRWTRVRDYVYPVAAQLAHLFGFQHERIHRGSLVPSSLDNQVDHLSKMVLNIMDRQGYNNYREAMHHAISSLHKHLLRNYGRWLRHVRLADNGRSAGSAKGKTAHSAYGSLSQNRTWAYLGPWEFLTIEEEQEWVCTSKLHQVMLFLLIHGEAANGRFLPEFICFVFFCASNALTLEPTSVEEYDPSTRGSGSAEQFKYELRPAGKTSGMPYPQDDFLESIVTPVYNFLEAEIAQKKELPIDERVMCATGPTLPSPCTPSIFILRLWHLGDDRAMVAAGVCRRYDDVNEFFWSRENVELLLRTPKDEAERFVALGSKATAAYHTLRANLRHAVESRGGAAHELRHYFSKTYVESVSMCRVLYVFSRVLIPHCVAWHALLAVAFYKSMHWRYVCTCAATHAILKLAASLYELSTPLTNTSLRGHRRIAVTCGYGCIPLAMLFDIMIRNDPKLYVFQGFSAVYLGLMLGQLVAQHSLLSDAGRKLHGRLSGRHHNHAFMGTALQLTVPLRSWIAYTSFWLLVGTLKLLFGYYGLAKPLVPPLIALWELDFDGGTGKRAALEYGWWYGLLTGESILRVFVIVLRTATPTMVFFFDTNVFYTTVSAFLSTLVLARARDVGHLTTWRGLLACFMETVEMHGQKLFASGVAPQPMLGALNRRRRAHHTTTDWCVEARSFSWQLMSRSWNEIVMSLRDCDLLTDAERDDMLFSSLQGQQVQEFFGVPEYIIFPTMISSPVFDSKAWTSELRHFRPAEPSMQQSCDLVCWLLVALGLTDAKDRDLLRDVLYELAHLTQGSMRHEPIAMTASLIALRTSLAALCAHLLELAVHLVDAKATEDKASSTLPGSSLSNQPSKTAPQEHLPSTPLPGHTPMHRGQGREQHHGEQHHGASACKPQYVSHAARATMAHAGLRRVTFVAQPDEATSSPASQDPSGGTKRVGIAARARRKSMCGGAGMRASCVRGMGRASTVRTGDAVDNGTGAPRAAAQANLARVRASVALMAAFGGGGSAPRLNKEQQEEARKSVGLEVGAEAEVIQCSDDLHDALPMIMEVLQNVGDIFSGEEMSHNAQHDVVKLVSNHDVVDDEVEAYSKLRKLVRLDKFSEPSSIVHALGMLAQGTAVTVLDALVRCLATPNPGGEPTNEEAKRQLMFFCNSLHNRSLSPPPPIGKMKSITSFTPYYGEDVTYSQTDLYSKRSKGSTVREVTEEDEVNLLDLLRALFPDEWDNFVERVEMDTATLRVGQYPLMELSRWASDRAQVLSRTVRGFLRNADGVRLLARMEGVSEEDLEWLVASKFEYVVSCQIYGKQRRSQNAADLQKADAIDALRREYAANLRIAYVDDPQADADQPYFASVLLGVEEETHDDHVMYKVRLPGNPIIGEGKPENQNHAVVFAHGEYLQTLDMNQDNYLGETLKMRNLLELFKGDVRIVGFPEHVFSVSGGAVAHFSASNEMVFGSTVQRFLTWPLMVRFHYGHPDVWDKVWAISSGGVAKASKTLHVSEDIFGGFNVVLRGGTIEYAEYVHCGKGRDMSFIAVNGFESKISAGGAVTTVSRDMLRLMRSFDIFRLFSFYCSMAGFYVTTLQSVCTAHNPMSNPASWCGSRRCICTLSLPRSPPPNPPTSADVVCLLARNGAATARDHEHGGVRAIRVCR